MLDFGLRDAGSAELLDRLGEEEPEKRPARLGRQRRVQFTSHTHARAIAERIPYDTGGYAFVATNPGRREREVVDRFFAVCLVADGSTANVGLPEAERVNAGRYRWEHRRHPALRSIRFEEVSDDFARQTVTCPSCRPDMADTGRAEVISFRAAVVCHISDTNNNTNDQ